jgi:hypothetical protein
MAFPEAGLALHQLRIVKAEDGLQGMLLQRHHLLGNPIKILGGRLRLNVGIGASHQDGVALFVKTLPEPDLKPGANRSFVDRHPFHLLSSRCPFIIEPAGRRDKMKKGPEAEAAEQEKGAETNKLFFSREEGAKVAILQKAALKLKN